MREKHRVTGVKTPLLKKNTAPTRLEKLELHENTIWRMQEKILEARPLEKIIDLASGKGIPGIPQPTPTQVEAANYALLRRIMPELKSITVKAEGGQRGDTERDIVRELAQFIGQVVSLKQSGDTLPIILDLEGARQSAPAGD